MAALYLAFWGFKTRKKEHDKAKGMTTLMGDDRLLRWTCTLWNLVIDGWQGRVCSITFSTWARVYINPLLRDGTATRCNHDPLNPLKRLQGAGLLYLQESWS